jgi:UDP-N-acetylmuramyl pentapeptide synthase
MDSTEDALANVPGMLEEGDVVLVKGSRRTGLDRLVNQLVETQSEGAG